MKKRVLAIMLACLMLVSLLPMGALAAGEELKCPGQGKNHYLDNCTSAFVETVAPICGDKDSYGYDLYICLVCGDYFAANFKQGNKDEKHDYVLVEDKDGYCAEYKCSKCGHVDEEKGHDWADATCGAPKTCKVCGKTDGKATGHKYNTAPDKVLADPDEINFVDGLAVYACTVCKEEKQVTILAHKCVDFMTEVAAKDATCLENGWKAHLECSKCERLYVTDKNGKLVEVEMADIAIAGKHVVPTTTTTVVKTLGNYLKSNVEATVTVKTYTNGKLELLDNKTFASTYYEMVAGESVTLELAKNNTLYFYSYEKDEDDNDIINLEITTTTVDSSVVTVPSDCYTQGSVSYKCAVCKENVKDLLPLAHNEIIDKKVDATCDTFGYIVYVCQTCGASRFEVLQPKHHSERPETLPTEGFDYDTYEYYDANPMPATCETAAFEWWYCEECDKVVKSYTGSALGHKKVVVNVEATCTQYGYTYAYCANENCSLPMASSISTTVPFDVDGNGKIDKGETKTFYVFLGEMLCLFTEECEIKVAAGFSKTNHTEPSDATAYIKVPTCTETGLKAYWCAGCQVSVVETLPALGHTKADKTTTVPATCQAKGYVAYMCTECGKIAELVKELTFTNDVIYNSYNEIASQHVDKDGNSTLTCTGQWIPENFEGCTNVGMTRWECSLCKNVMLVKGDHTMPEDLAAMPSVVVLTFSSKDGFVQMENKYEGVEYTATVEIDAEHEFYTYYISCETGLAADAAYIMGYVDSYSTEVVITVTLTPVFDATTGEFAAKAPTCTENGYTAQYYCTSCGFFVQSETYKVLETDKDGKPTKEEHPELKALGHDKVVLIEAIKDTCTVVGRTEGWFCKTCGYEEKSVKVDVLDGHKLVASVENAFSVDAISGHLCVCANGCGYEAIKNFDRICDHEWVFNRKASSASTCTKNGYDVYDCALCGKQNKVELKLAAHVNAKGEKILACSEQPKEDRKCVTCEATIEYVGGHQLVTTTYKATCLRPAYLMITCSCTGCEYAVAYEYGDPAGHDYQWEAYVKDEKTGVIVGAAYRCSVCGNKELRTVENVTFTFAIENAANAKGELTDGSLVKVTVAVTGSADNVWGFKFDIPYSENLTLVKTNYCVDVCDEFVIYGQSNSIKDGAQWVTVAGNANGSADVAINGTLKLVELYFVVDQDLPGTVSVDLENVQLLNFKGEEIGFIATGAEAKTVALMDVDKNGVIDMADILAAYKLILDGKYNAAADIDKNGVVEAADLQAMYKYLIGAKTYAATRKTGIAAV